MAMTNQWILSFFYHTLYTARNVSLSQLSRKQVLKSETLTIRFSIFQFITKQFLELSLSSAGSLSFILRMWGNILLRPLPPLPDATSPSWCWGWRVGFIRWTGLSGCLRRFGSGISGGGGVGGTITLTFVYGFLFVVPKSLPKEAVHSLVAGETVVIGFLIALGGPVCALGHWFITDKAIA